MRPLSEFDNAIRARQTIKDPTAQIGTSSGTIISALNNEKHKPETANALVKYWKNVPEYEKTARRHAAESRVSRALLMLASSKAYSWVVSITTEAIECPTKDTWVSQLAKDVLHQWGIRHRDPTVPHEATFNSKDYLPLMTDNIEATVTLKRRMHKDEEEGRRTIKIISFIIETWLRFPTSRHQSNKSKVRCALLGIMTKYMPFSIFFLDDVWQMYLSPYRMVIHASGQGQRIEEAHNEKILILFEQAIQNHVMAEPTSKEHELLMVLNKYAEAYHRITSRMENQDTMPGNAVRLLFSRNLILCCIFLMLVHSQRGISTHWRWKLVRPR